MTARQSIYIYLAVVTALGALSGLMSPANQEAGAVIGLIWMLLGPVAAYVWFRLDSVEHGFNRTAGWSRGVILFTVLAVPMYLFRSRVKGQRLKAMVGFVGICVLSVVLPILATLPFGG